MKYILANHKMNFTSDEIDQYMSDLFRTTEFSLPRYELQTKIEPGKEDAFEEYAVKVMHENKKTVKPISDEHIDVVLCPSFTNLFQVGRWIMGENKTFGIGAQDCYFLNSGAYTGAVSAEQLKNLAEYVLVGHSERRQIFNDTNEIVNLKIKSAVENGLVAVLCIGETAKQRESGETKGHLTKQLKECLEGINVKILNKDWITKRIVIAYEPIWAIGTGKIPTAKEIADVVKIIKKQVDAPVLYGGSVSPENTAEIFQIKGIDGLLVGGASLDPEKFATIVSIAREG